MATYAERRAQMLPIIQAAAERHGVNPKLLEIVASIESSFNPNARSKAGAVGLFQFMPKTAQGYKVDPLSPESSADGAARYLKDLAAQFGNNTALMLAQYNGGNAGVRHAKEGRVFEETAGYYDKFNKHAKKLGIPDRIDTTAYTVIPARGSRAGTQQSPRSAAVSPQPEVPQVRLRSADQGLTDNASDIDRDTMLRLQLEKDYADEQRSFVESARRAGGAFVEGAKASNLLFQAVNEARMRGFDDDPNWQPSPSDLVADLTARKVPQENWEYVLQGAGSQESYLARINRVEEGLKARQEIGDSPVAGILGSFGGAILDPIFWASGGVGAIASTIKAGKVAKVAAGAAAGAATDASLTAVVGKEADPFITNADIAMNALGGAVGGAMGALAAGNRAARIPDPQQKPPVVAQAPATPQPHQPYPQPDPAPQPPQQAPLKEPEPEDVPAPTPVPEEPVIQPPKEPVQPDPVPEADVPVNPPVQRADPWSAEWDEPERVAGYNRGAKGDTLLLPPNLKARDQFAYIAKYGNAREKAAVALIEKNAKDIDFNLSYLKRTPRGTPSKRDIFFAREADSPSAAADLLRRANRFAERGKPTSGANAYPLDRAGNRWVAVQNHALHYNGRGITAENLIHESIHSLTITGIDKGAMLARIKGAATSSLTKSEARVRQAYLDLKEQYDAVRKAFPSDRGEYAMKDLHEFAAEMASGPWEARLTQLVGSTPSQAIKDRFKALAQAFRRFAAKVFGKEINDNPVIAGYYGRVIEMIEATTELRRAAPQARASSSGPRGTEAAVIPDSLPEAVEKIGTTYGKEALGFALENLLQNKTVPAPIRAYAAKLIGTTAGYKEGTVVGRNVWDDVKTLRDTMYAKRAKVIYAEFDQWYMKQKDLGRFSGWSPFNKDTARKEFSELRHDVIAGLKESDDPHVLAAVAAERRFTGEWVDLINNPGKLDGTTVKGITQRWVDELDEEGAVKLDADGNPIRKLTEGLPKDPDYIPFRLHPGKINEVFARYGDAEVHNFMKEAFYSGNPALRDVWAAGGKDYGLMFAKWYFKQVQDSKVNRKYDFLHDLETAQNGDAMRKAMVEYGIDPVDADRMVAGLLEGNKGQSAYNSNLRRRAHFDRRFEATMADGSRLRVHDLVERDMDLLMDNYNGRMAGAVALANHFPDVDSWADFATKHYELTYREFGKLGNQMSDSQVREIRNALDTAMNHILARPLDEQSNFNSALSMLRNVNGAAKLGGAVMLQVAEISQTLGTFGLMRTLQLLPEMAGAIRRSKLTGKVDHKLIAEYEDLVGSSGLEMLRYSDPRVNDEWSTMNKEAGWAKKADKADYLSRRAIGGVLKWTGMTGATVLERRLGIIAITREFQDAALHGRKMAYNKSRLAWMGLDDAGVEAVMEGMRKYSKPNAKGKMELSPQAWFEGDPQSFAKWRTALQRESSRLVLENDLGAHIPQVDKGWVKSLVQFRTFVLQAHNKALLFGVNQRDAQTALTLMYGLATSVMVQVVRAHMRASQMSEEDAKAYLEKSMDLGPGGVLFRGAASMAQAALLPQLIDTVSPFGNLFEGYRSTTEASTLLQNPSVDLFSGVIDAVKKGTGVLTGQDTLDQRDAKAILSVIPFNNALGISSVLGAGVGMLPSHTKADLLFQPEEDQ